MLLPFKQAHMLLKLNGLWGSREILPLCEKWGFFFEYFLYQVIFIIAAQSPVSEFVKRLIFDIMEILPRSQPLFISYKLRIRFINLLPQSFILLKLTIFMRKCCVPNWSISFVSLYFIIYYFIREFLR